MAGREEREGRACQGRDEDKEAAAGQQQAPLAATSSKGSKCKEKNGPLYSAKREE